VWLSSAAHVPRHAGGISAGQATHGRVGSMGIDPPRPIFHPCFHSSSLAAQDKAAVNGEEDVLLAADRGNFAVVIHTLPTPHFSGLDASRIARSGTDVGPAYGRAQHEAQRDPGR
jgi:hypothetical protein